MGSLIAVFPQVFTSDPDPYVPPVPVYDSEYDYVLNEEKRVGIWIDGKDIYQTVINIAVSSIPSTSLATINKIAHNIQGIDKPLFMRDVTQLTTDSNGKAKWPIPMDVSSTSYTSQYHLYLERFTKGELWIRRGTNSTEQNQFYVALQYTKV